MKLKTTTNVLVSLCSLISALHLLVPRADAFAPTRLSSTTIPCRSTQQQQQQPVSLFGSILDKSNDPAVNESVSSSMGVPVNKGSKDASSSNADETSNKSTSTATFPVDETKDALGSIFSQTVNAFGFKEGSRTYFGLPGFDLDPIEGVSEEVALQRRAQAVKDLINLGPEERERRDLASNVLFAVSIAYVFWISAFVDRGDFAGHFLRFLSVVPLVLATGYKLSAKRGLCNIAQVNSWEVDGKGLTKIEDPNIAKAILDKVNQLNTDTFIRVAVPVTIFALLPQSASTPLVWITAIFAALYYAKDQIPQLKQD